MSQMKKRLENSARKSTAHLTSQALGKGEGIREVDLELIDPNPYQPRKHFDEKKLEELAHSIKQFGLMQPVIIVPKKDRYILIAGERRLRASKIAQTGTIKVIIRNATEEELRILAMLENTHRENLSALEQAIGYKEIMTASKLNSVQALSDIVGVDRRHLATILSLNDLPENITDAIKGGVGADLSLQVLERLSKLGNDKVAHGLFSKIVEGELNRKRALELIEHVTAEGDKKKVVGTPPASPTLWGRFKSNSKVLELKINKKSVPEKDMVEVERLMNEIKSILEKQ